MYDERLAKIIALWRSTQHEGERQAARGKAERIAKELGMSFEAAVAADQARNNPGNSNIFDDWMEAREPGHKAAAARQKAEKAAAHEARLRM
jgi:hypothetical protein